MSEPEGLERRRRVLRRCYPDKRGASEKEEEELDVASMGKKLRRTDDKLTGAEHQGRGQGHRRSLDERGASEEEPSINSMRKKRRVTVVKVPDVTSEVLESHGEQIEQDSGRQLLEQKLSEEGLDTNYWLPKLEEILGVTNVQALNHLDHEDYLKLELHLKYHWEKKALKKILKVPDSNLSLKKVQEERSDVMKRKQEQAKLTLKELTQMQSAGIGQDDEQVKQKLENLRLAMSIPKEYWPPSGKALNEVIENLHKELKLAECSLLAYENLDDKEVLKLASGGRALEGIYKTKNLEDLMKKRDQLINVPQNFILFGPEQGPVFQTKEFSSYISEATFTQVMDSLGFSSSCKAKVGYMGFSLETSNLYSNMSEFKQKKKSHAEKAYICTIKYNYIPLASCFFQKQQIKLSSAALHELKEIEALLSHTTKQDTLQMMTARFGNFFNRFGSHVDTGPFHFGGVFSWKASSEGFKSENLEEMKRITTQALNVYVGASYSGFGVSIGGSVGVSSSHSAASFQGNSTEVRQKNIQLSVTKTGGPVEVDSLPQWKTGLLASNKTWCVIDRRFNLVPVWDILLSNHKNDLKNVFEVSRSLMEAYKVIAKQEVNVLFGEELASAVNEAQAFLQDIASWEVNDAEEQLKKLILFKQKLIEKTKNESTWINICLSNKAFSNFLSKVFETYEKVPTNESMYIKTQMRCLVDSDVYSAENSKRYSSIMKWIYHSVKEQEEMRIANFDQFIQILSQEKRNLEANLSFKSCTETVQEAQVKSTCNINLSLYSLLKALRATKKTDIELLMLSFAVTMGYSLETSYFQYHLGCSEIDFMLNEMQEAHKEYSSLKDQCLSRAHAFLLLTSLTVAAKCKEVTAEQRNEHLCFMMDHMKESLSNEVFNVVQRLKETKDLKSLEKELHALISGNVDGAGRVTYKENLVKELSDISVAVNQVNTSTLVNEDIFSSGNDTHLPIPTQELSDLIKQLGLENYYPKKMTQEHVHVINQFTLAVTGSHPSKESELPHYYLQKLMIMDYRARDLICKSKDVTDPCYVAVSNEMCLPDESESIMETLFGDHHTAPEIAITKWPHVHPMNVQMAIYHCADDFMRQWISTKLSVCHFAIPFLVPNPSTGEIEFPLWSFRQIKKNWQQNETSDSASGKAKYYDNFISKVRTPMVSFFRLGKSAHSKTQLINSLLSEHNHNIFFHRHCRGSSNDSFLMAGVAEIFWYCPSGKDSDRFEQFTSFTNLHGDAEEYIKQATFLQSMSSVNVMFLSSSDRNAMSSDIFKVLIGSTKPLILLCTDLEKKAPVKCKNVVKMSIKNRNESELIDELTAVINDLLASAAHTFSLDDCATVARHSGFLIDEDNMECKDGHSLANTMMSRISVTKVADMKEALLPLQGPLWHRWCKKDKELSRLKEKGNRSIEQHRSEIESEKNDIRQEQVERAYPLSDLMKSLIEILQCQPEQTKLYFLHWFKVALDDMSSGQLVDLHQKYHELWSKIRTEKGQKSDRNHEEHEHLNKISNKISESMLGLEHISREVGQIYEALHAEEKSDTSDTLPKIAADLMINGFPVELMDGDASYVPLKWVEAVFDELIKKLGDKRVFVLSVLGIQSTGKSTLLNTMFGLQFAVSAGRCTRGAFMQLVKIDENFKQTLGFDFILVVDTEGLRSVELTSKPTLNHDNELATFVIGLGNMTLINIYGENPSEIQDILQITVQAFLRMKQVKLSSSCLFVHQNVGDLAARDKNMAGRRSLQQKLDEMAKTAGQHELCEVTRFSDVIRFDADSHIHYFSHLWEGNPPMAPLNPNYSQNVQDLRNQILMMAKKDCESRSRVLQMSQLKTRIQDLWKALLNENFVFSFKNTLEISAYNNMETKFSGWTWKLRSHMLNLQSKYNNRIKNGDMSHIERKHLEEQVQEQYDDIMKDLEVYFTEDRDCEILIQWKSNVENRVQILKQDLTDETERKLKELIEYKKSQSKLDENKSEYEDLLIKKSKDLALKFKNEALDEMKLRENFDQVWIKWVTEVSNSVPKTEDPNILVDVENAILSHFQQEPNILTKIADMSKLKAFRFNKSDHVHMKRNIFYLKKTLTKNDTVCISQVKSVLVNFVNDYVKNKQQQKMSYNVNYIHEILNEISKVADFASTGSSFKLTSAYKIDLSLYLCHIAANKLICMHKEFQKSNNPVVYLESKREDFFNCFKIFCQGATSTTTFAEVLCNKLKKATQLGTYEKAALKLADQMRSDFPAFNGNRAKLEKHILKSLAENEDFEEYRKYIHFPKEYFETYIKTCVDEYCLAKHQRLTKILNMTLDHFRYLIVIAIGEATQVVKDKNGNASMWLDELCRKFGDELNISRSELKVIEHQEITDLEFLLEVMSNRWESTVESLKQAFKSVSLDSFHVKPHEILAKQLCGCWEKCPFCKAVCTNTISGHDGEHSVHFHRPLAITGHNWYKTDHLVIEICSSLVASDCKFVLSESNKIPFKNYRQAGPPHSNWSITRDTSNQSYWKWFVCHFREILAQNYCGKFEEKGKIPPAWEKITKQNVISELNQL